jgi:hypothetical protein
VTVIASSPFFAREYDHPMIIDEMIKPSASVVPMLNKKLFFSPFMV